MSHGKRAAMRLECFHGKRRFTDQLLQPTETVELLDQEIQCDKQQPMKPGMQPKEAEQMDFRDNVLEWKKETSDRLEKLSMHFKSLEETWHQERLRAMESQSRLAQVLSVIAVVVSVVMPILVAILAHLLQRS